MGQIKVGFNGLERVLLGELGDLNLVDSKVLESYLSELYPRRIIKRLVYKPYLGHYIPYIDVYDPRYGSQLFAFHGKVDINMSLRRLCSGCFNELDGDFIERLPIPVSLCHDCYSRLFHGYWDCLWDVYGEFQYDGSRIGENNGKGYDSCDLLLPECGHILSGDEVNPCLRNHAIGMIIQDNNRIKVTCERLENIKHLMTLNGGLFVFILGIRNKILDIISLSSILKQFRQLLEVIIKEYKEKYQKSTSNFYGIKKDHSDFRILSVERSNYLLEKNLGNYLLDWIILRYLLRDNSGIATDYLNSYYSEVFEFIRFFVKGFIEKKNNDLEILDFLELHDFFSPLTPNFISDLEEQLLLVSDSESSYKRLVEKLKSNRSAVLNSLMSMFVNKEKLLMELEEDYFNTCEVAGNFGSFIIIKTNLSEKWTIFNIQDFVGREIF